MEPFPVLFVGDPLWNEFRAVHDWLRQHAALQSVADAAAASELLAAGHFVPRLIVLAQIWPGQYSTAEVEQLLRAAPLARVNELLGGWCEGETRTGTPIAGSLRLYWHQWLARLAPEFARAENGGRPLWELPATANDEERLLGLPKPHDIGRGRLLAMIARNAESADVLCEAAAMFGFAAIWVRRPRQPLLTGIHAAVWEAPSLMVEAGDNLRLWRAVFRDAQFAALCDFPRVEDRDRLLAAGARIVVSRPFWLHDLFEQLANITPS